MSGISTYQQNAVATQSPGRIIVLLYDGAVKFLTQAIAEIKAGNTNEKGVLINKAIEIIIELNLSLNLETGGEVGENLRSLYNFMAEQLNKANASQDTRAITEVISLLSELNEAWRAITD